MQAANVKIEPKLQPANNDSNIARPANSHPKLIPRPPVSSSEVTQPLHVYGEPETPATAGPVVDPELSIHPTLRSPGFVPTANMMPTGVPVPPEHSGAVQMTGQPSAPGPDSDPGVDGRKAKRELSQSKRAAQNRAAQRAFRQRKEGYIKKLEQQVRDYGEMEQQFKMIQSENYALREYIVHLQSRLLDAQVEPPQPPPNISLTAPPAHSLPQPAPPAQEGAPPAEPTPNTGSAAGAAALDAVAQAVQSLSRSEAVSSYKPDGATQAAQAAEDDRTDEEISRQLQQADAVPAANM